MMNACQTPVVFIIFNRPETTRAVFAEIARARPAKLLIVADGPRENKAGEAELCREVRQIAMAVDWPCEVLTNLAEQNLGCRNRVITGLDWAFSLVDEAIILEDDCKPDPSFFPYCSELLERYRGDTRIRSISGSNLIEQHMSTSNSYYFSQLGGIWGWATWKSAWKTYDRYLKTWPELKSSGAMFDLFPLRRAAEYWTRVFDSMHEDVGPNTWDYQWVYSNFINNGLIICPRVNLVENIGFGAGATHTANVDPRFTPAAKSIDFPLKHPAGMIPSRSLDAHLQNMSSLPLWERAKGKIKRMTGPASR